MFFRGKGYTARMNDPSLNCPEMSHSTGLKLRPTFVEQLYDVAESIGVGIEWSSDFWICDLQRTDGNRQRVVGGYFPINNAAAAQLANDKSATSATLQRANVQRVEHTLFRPQGRDLEACREEVVAKFSLPLVLKPNLEAGGVDVFRATTPAELKAALTALLRRYRAIAICPYVEIAVETRVVVLDGVSQFAYEKHLKEPTSGRASEWRRNLRLGSEPRLIAAEAGPPQQLALATCRALDLRFATVDVVDVDGVAQVLEVNSSVTLDKFSLFSRSNWRLARGTYARAIAAYWESPG